MWCLFHLDSFYAKNWMFIHISVIICSSRLRRSLIHYQDMFQNCRWICYKQCLSIALERTDFMWRLFRSWCSSSLCSSTPQVVDGEVVMLSAHWERRRGALLELHEQLQQIPSLITDLESITARVGETDTEISRSRLISSNILFLLMFLLGSELSVEHVAWCYVCLL